MTAEKVISAEERDFIVNKLGSKLWRMSNLYHIVDKNDNLIIMRLNSAQRKVLTDFKHTKKIILKSRQQGISTLYLAYNMDSCLTKPNFSAGIQSYGKDESRKLNDRALIMWNNLDQRVKELLGVTLIKSNQDGLKFSNGSMLKIGNFRGDTLSSLHVSELGKIAKKFPEKAKELKTGAFQAVGKNNKITIESTAEGKSGLFYDMWQKAERHVGELSPFDFQAIFLSWVQDPDCNIDTPQEINAEFTAYFMKLEEKLGVKLTNTQKWWYVSKHGELKDDMKQEYPSFAEEAFEQSLEGTYYQHEYANITLKEELYDANLKVHSSMDLGMNDTFSIGFFQIRPGDKPIEERTVIIGEYENNGYGLEHYREIFNYLTKEFGWMHGNTYVPHDIKVKELIAGKSRWDAMLEMGWRPILVRRHRIQDGIEQTRQLLKVVKIQNDCELILNAIQNYRKKRDDKYGVYLDSPVHDEFSHTADMLRYLAMGLKYSPITDIFVKKVMNKRKTKRRRGFDV